jgi:hypothetical protein
VTSATHAAAVAAIAKALEPVPPAEFITLWSWRWRGELHGRKWVSEGNYAPADAEFMLARMQRENPKIKFCLSKGAPAATEGR